MGKIIDEDNCAVCTYISRGWRDEDVGRLDAGLMTGITIP